ncbi:MAG: hypothetical protein V4585_07285 [Bacteroidota bacterium]
MKNSILLFLIMVINSVTSSSQVIEKNNPFSFSIKNKTIIIPDSICRSIEYGKIYVHLTINKYGKLIDTNILRLDLKSLNENIRFFNDNILTDSSKSVPLSINKYLPFIRNKLKYIRISRNKYSQIHEKNYGVIPFILINKRRMLLK